MAVVTIRGRTRPANELVWLMVAVEPILDLRLLRIRSFAASSMVLFMGSIALFGATGLLPLYFQQARGHSVLETGLLLIPQGVV